MECVISCRNVQKSFADVQVLGNGQLELYGGEIHALVGENGAGKSTLIKILSGIYKKDGGEIWHEGQKVEIENVEDAKKLGIAVIHQELSVVKALNAVENIFLGKEILNGGIIKSLNLKEMTKQAEEILDMLGVHIPLNVKAGSLSIAQCQLIEIAKALRENAKIFILDEPTTALTLDEVEALFRVLEGLKRNGTAILYISHRMEEIYKISDRITIFRDGCFVDSRKTADISDGELISLMVGRELKNMYPQKKNKIKETVLEVSNLCWGKHVKNVSFSLKKGELLGIGGLVGAGRTEMVQLLAGINCAESGDVILNGEKLSLKHPSDAIRNKIVLVPEDRKKSGLHVELSVKTNITMGTIGKFVQSFKINQKNEKESVNKIIDRLSVKCAGMDIHVKSLSGGNQQKIAIGKWLLVDDVKIVILDEPTRGVDVGAKFEIYTIMEEILCQGASIIMVSSDLPELLAMSDRILVMREGCVMGEVTAEEATEEKIMYLATGGK